MSVTEQFSENLELGLEDDKGQIFCHKLPTREENSEVTTAQLQNQLVRLHSEGNDRRTIFIKVSETFKDYPEQQRKHLIKRLFGEKGADYVLIKKSCVNNETLYKILVINVNRKRSRSKSTNQDDLTNNATNKVPDIETDKSFELTLNLNDCQCCRTSRSTTSEDSTCSAVEPRSANSLMNTNNNYVLQATTTFLKISGLLVGSAIMPGFETVMEEIVDADVSPALANMLANCFQKVISFSY